MSEPVFLIEHLIISHESSGIPQYHLNLLFKIGSLVLFCISQPISFQLPPISNFLCVYCFYKSATSNLYGSWDLETNLHNLKFLDDAN
jgi:hypothetical protein